MFSPRSSQNPTLLKAAGLAILATIVAVEIGLLNRLLETVNLTVDQWVVCVVVSLVASSCVAEVKKLLKIRTTEAAVRVVPEAAPAAA